MLRNPLFLHLQASLQPKRVYSYLWSLCLNPPHASRAVDDSVLGYDFTGVDLTEGSNNTATGEDHVPSNVS